MDWNRDRFSLALSPQLIVLKWRKGLEVMASARLYADNDLIATARFPVTVDAVTVSSGSITLKVISDGSEAKRPELKAKDSAEKPSEPAKKEDSEEADDDDDEVSSDSTEDQAKASAEKPSAHKAKDSAEKEEEDDDDDDEVNSDKADDKAKDAAKKPSELRAKESSQKEADDDDDDAVSKEVQVLDASSGPVQTNSTASGANGSISGGGGGDGR